MADSDSDLPELVESSDEEIEDSTKITAVAHAEKWLKRSRIFLEKQELWNRVFCLGPFLFGVNNIVAAAWIKALLNVKLILNENRQFHIKFLEWQEWEYVDLMDHAIEVVHKNLRNKDTLTKVIDLVHRLDDCKSGVVIDVDLALEEAEKVSQIADIWRVILKHELSRGKEKAAKFAVLYIVKICLQRMDYENIVVKEEIADNEQFLLFPQCFLPNQTVQNVVGKGEIARYEQFLLFPNVFISHPLKTRKNKGLSGKELKANFSLDREHVFRAEDKSGDFVLFTQQNVKPDSTDTKAEEFKKTGNELFAKKEYTKSEDLYTKAARQNPFCHIYYSNRAQAYHKLSRFKEALADGRRAITIKPDFAKGHHRYAKAFHQLGQLDTAIRKIRMGLELCQPANKSDDHNVKDLEELHTQYVQEKAGISHLSPIPNDLKETLSALIVTEGDADNIDALDLKVPPLKKHTGDLSIFNETDRDSSRERSNFSNQPGATEKEKKKMKKRKDEEPKKKKQVEEDKKKKDDSESSSESLLSKTRDTEKKKQDEEKKEFDSYLKEAWEALKEDMYKNAMLNYRKALDMITNPEKMKLYGIDDIDLVTLKYACGISAVKTGLFKNINDGVERFQDIIDNNQDVRFPLAYFGLGKAYIALFRFSDALEPLEAGKTIAKNITYVQVTWPGTNKKIPENESRELLSQIKELLQLCKVPPVPDATCRHHTDMTDTRIAIYLNDPGFKGCIKITCQMNCIIPFHMTCWKTYKQGLYKLADKDVIDTLCPTPDCAGFIVKLEVTRHDSITREYLSTKYSAVKEPNKGKKPSVKQKSTSETKLEKKQEKKEMRKLKKKQRHEEITDVTENDNEDSGVVITDGSSASAFVEEMLAERQPLPALKDTTVLKKEELDSKANASSGKSKRARKKKDKSKQLLNVEVSFSDRKEELLLNENSVVSDEETTKSQTPFSVPSELQTQINTFEKNYQGSAKPLFQPDEITENLFSYFSDILHANGPLAVDDTKIQQELEVFPPEAIDKIKQVGGLCDFLKQSLKFAVIDDVISLLSDAKRAREIALLKRSEKENSASVTVPGNAWTTVGKSTNNIDSLKESTFSHNTVSFPQVTSSKTTLTSHNPGLVSSSSSNSLVSVGSDSNNLSQNVKPVTNGISEPTAPLEKNTRTKKSSDFDNLDSIDDFPSLNSSLPKKKHKIEEINDLDTVSDPDSDGGIAITKPAFKKGSFDDRSEMNLSRNSSHSDLSEKSNRSDLSADLRPKPLRTLGVEKIGLGKKITTSATNWDKLENDFDSSWNKVKKEDYEKVLDFQGFSSVGLELKQATEDFVRKSDEKFVAELADSVVDKLYQGKTVSDTERQNTLNKVSSDIWKDFEKSASSGNLRGPGLWADTPAGQDYSNNLGKFATDFMKKHYEKKDESNFSPTSSLKSPFASVNSSFESGLPLTNTAISSSWTSTSSAPETSVNSSFSVPSSGYNLFSGPTWGFDAFSSTSSMSPTLPQAIRPPNLATSYYQRGPVPLNHTPGLFPSSDYPNFSAPVFPNVRMPPPFVTPYPTPKVEKKEIQVQVAPITRTVGVITETYEPFKEEYLKLKKDMNEAVKLMNDIKVAYDKQALDLKTKDETIKELKTNIVNKESMYDYEKKNWINEKKSYSDKIREVQQQLEAKEKSEKDLKDRMQNQEKKVNELAVLANDQRTKDLGEIKKLLEKTEKIQEEIEMQTRRAMTSELELLKAKFSTAKGFMERSQMEANYHSQRISGQISKLKDDSMSIPPALQQTLDYWKMVLQKTEENLIKLKTDSEKQMTEIRNGKMYSELSPWSVENPPQMPEPVKAFMFGTAGQMMMQRGPMQQHSPRTSLSGVGAAGNGSVSLAPTVMSPASMSQVPPKPLTPISSAPGLIPPRPLTSLQSPLTVSSKPSPLRPLRMQQQPMTSFEKLMFKLNNTFPNHTRQEFNTWIQELRQEKGGSLSGMTMEDIVKKVGEKIGRQGTTSPHNLGQAPSARTLPPPPGINKSWAFTASGLGEPSGPGYQRIETFQEEEDPCVICHEEMTSQRAVTLECNHTFHDECIRKWFQEQSTCPNCRVHTLLSDEFPSLNG